MSDGGSAFEGLAILLVLAVLYFVPWIVAHQREVKNQGPIIVINVFLGWTLIGWVIALAMAVGSSPRELPPPTTGDAAPISDSKTCPQCAEEVKAEARVCRYCGHQFGGE